VDRADGRKAVRLPVLGALDLEAVQVLIQGVIPLFRDLRTREKEGAVFNRDCVNDNRSETARVLDWLRATKRGRKLDAAGLQELALVLRPG
jgi:hypothetical protein